MNRWLKFLRLLFWVVMSAVCSVLAVGQDGSTGQSSGGAPPAATGPSAQNAENPPLTGLDKPVSEPIFGGRSYLVPGAQLSQSADGYTEGGGNTYDVTRLLGSVDLRKNWRASQFDLNYIGGGSFYEGPNYSGNNVYQEHTLAAAERILWRTGQLAIRDSFAYLPEGTFGFDSYGGAGAFDASGGLSGIGPGSGLGSGIAGSTPTGAFGGVGYGSFGLQRRIDNLSAVDISQALSPRTSVTLAGAYDIGHYLDKSSSPFTLFNSEQLSAQVGYNRLLNARDQIGVSYSYQQMHFPEQSGVGSIRSHVWNVLYGHRITGRLNFVAGAGPQLTSIHTPPTLFELLPGLFAEIPARTVTSISVSGTVTLDYTVSSRTNVNLNYLRYISAGSGYFAGAKTDAVSAGISHLFARRWTGSFNGGYSRSSNLQSATVAGAANSSAYNYWYAGASLRRQIGRHFDAFASYQYGSFGFAKCTTGLGCGEVSHHHTGVVGIEWHPDPLRLD